MTDSWVLKVSGTIDGHTLDRLRAELGLSRLGRLADDWDELFGEVAWEVQGQAVRIELWRDVDSLEWRLDLEAPAPLAEAVSASVLARVEAALRSTGLGVASVFKRP
ncbi:hypothetical protein KBX06_15900 [Micromonospora sp. C31]|uniref:hypothetical protein n=1 Tax=Micromonospora sp. C31 TaxID=2824876 RepID=UPI001B38E588|nr:hypothetical protein [Micromonospora sp. C31]MBQ1074640.1 hypothetical protein [Micromonospora sp. C31]